MKNDVFLTRRDDIQYNMSFSEVLEELFDKENMKKDSAWFQGNLFKDGVLIALTPKRELHMYYFAENNKTPADLGPLKLSDDHYYQVYRRLKKTKADARRE